MAETVPPVLIELQLETARIAAQMQQLQGNFADFGKTVEKQGGFLSQFKATATGVFAGNIMANGLNMVKNALTGAIADAQEYEKAVAQLNAGIKSTGNVAGLSVEGLKAQAAALEEMSAVDENLIMQSQGVFQTFTNVRNVVGEGNDIFNQASVAALDLSVKMKGDLQGATVQLGKALNDPIKGITALTRVGVVFTDAQKAQIKTLVQSGDVMGAQKIILAEMKTEFGGAAAAAGDTFAGAVSRAKDKVQDFARDLITGLQPILLSIGKTIGDLYNKYLAPLFSWMNKNREAVALFVGIIGTAVIAFNVYKGVMAATAIAQELYVVALALMKGAKLGDVVATEAQTGAHALLNAVMNANPIALVVLAIAALAAGFVYAWNHSKSFREMMIAVGKAGLTAISSILEQVGYLATGILKVVTGPMRLLLKGLQMLGVKGAGEVLKDINGAIDGVGKFFDNASKKVEGYKKTLDGLADKKITLPSFGKAPTTPGGGTDGADAPGTTVGKTKEQVAAEKAAAKQRVKDIAAANKEVTSIYDKMHDAIDTGHKKMAEALKKRDQQIADVKKKFADLETKITEKKNAELAKNEEDHTKAVSKAREDAQKRDAQIEIDYIKKKAAIEGDYAKKKADLNAAAQDKIAKATASATEKQAAIVQKGIDRLTNAFASGTATSISQIFKDGAKTADDVIGQLKNKLAAAKELQANAGALAAAGYSQVFIEDIVKQGPEAGNAMAKALLAASPEATSQLQDLYNSVEDVSKHGLDSLAAQMSTSTSFATEELLKEYEAVPMELAKLIAETNNELQKSLSEANANYLEKLAEAAATRSEALAETQTRLTEALAEADTALAEANKATMDEFNKAIKENQDALAEALLEVQKNYDDAIAAIVDATKEKLASLQADLDATIQKLKDLGAATDAANAAANNPAAGYIPPTAGRTDMGGNTSYYNKDMAYAMSAAGRAATINNFNTSVTGVNMSDPNAAAKVVDNTMRFGATQSLARVGAYDR